MARDSSLTKQSIPTLDLSRADSTDPEKRAQCLNELKLALTEVGFLYLQNHGVPDRIFDDINDLLPALFRIPEDSKQQCNLVNSPHFLGYSSFKSETTAGVQDQREQFELANELPDAFAVSRNAPLYLRLQGPNQWPSHPLVPRCREIVEAYISAMQSLAKQFLKLVEEALGLSEHALAPFTGPQDRLKLLHYRQMDANADAHTQGVGPHKDSSGWMTFLFQASGSRREGLQVLTKDGDWIDVPPMGNTLVVNMGQAFEVVTNGVCKATTHRVLLPPGEYDRYSVPFFQGVRQDMTKDDLKSMWNFFNKDKWETRESIEGQLIDSPFLRGKYDTWGEAQLRTKIRSHRDVGRKHYADVYDQYINEER